MDFHIWDPSCELAESIDLRFEYSLSANSYASLLGVPGTTTARSFATSGLAIGKLDEPYDWGLSSRLLDVETSTRASSGAAAGPFDSDSEQLSGMLSITMRPDEAVGLFYWFYVGGEARTVEPPIPTTPLPASLPMIAAGVGALGYLGRRSHTRRSTTG